MRVAVTGATGFVGAEVLRRLADAGHAAVPLTRRASGLPGEVVVGELGAAPIDPAALAGADAIVHLAARTYVPEDTEADPLDTYRRVNVEGTRTLLAASVAARVRRFVFVSSIKAVAEASQPGRPLTDETEPAPEDAYGVSKLEAEALVRMTCERAGIEWVVLRPPLVFGPGVKGNFARLIKLARSGIPLPLGAVRNRRSMVDVANLAAAIVCACTAKDAAGRTLMIADSTLSTSELLRAIAQAAGVPSRLIPVPAGMLEKLGALAGRGEEVRRLCGSLEIDAAPAAAALGWRPVRSLEEGLRVTVAGESSGRQEP